MEFPSPKKFTTIASWKYQEDGELGFDGKLLPRWIISLTTNDALGLPLPHPLLFQLCSLISHIIGLKAAAGFPLFPNFEAGDPDDRGAPSFTDTPLVPRPRHHEQPTSDYNPLAGDGWYDSGDGNPHIMCWFELKPLAVSHVLAPADFSDSESDAEKDVQHLLKREHESDFDTDAEQPRKYTVVHSEVNQRMQENAQLLVTRDVDMSEIY